MKAEELAILIPDPPLPLMSPCNNWSCCCIHLLLWSAEAQWGACHNYCDIRLCSCSTFDPSPPPTPPPSPPRSDVAGDTWSVCQTSIDINPFLQQTSHHSPALSTPLPGLPGLPCVRRARGMPAVSVSILIMSELYSFERNICRIRNSAALDLQLGAAGTGR